METLASLLMGFGILAAVGLIYVVYAVYVVVTLVDDGYWWLVPFAFAAPPILISLLISLVNYIVI